jgi:hypothetical protein
MAQRSNIINVVGDMETFLDRLLAHVEEENCQHSISDFLQEYFDKKNNVMASLGPQQDSSAIQNNPIAEKELKQN